jgi:SAM-dependent methyltransferase
MRTRFYDSTKMGDGFDHNPVLAVQRRQFTERVDVVDPSTFNVLDLGCGAGTTTRRVLLDCGISSVVGADLSAAAVRRYVDVLGRPAVRVDATALPFGDASFDMVISDDVVEHLVDTDEYAREIHRVLRPGGWLMLSTPNLAAWFNRIALLGGVQPAFTEVSFERVFGRPGADIVGHLRLFTSRATVQFLEHHRFEVVDVRGASFDALNGLAARVDRLLARFPTVAGNTAVVARAVPPDP